MSIASPSTTDPCAWIEAAAAAHGERPFLHSHRGGTLSYAALARAVGRVAAVLHTLGVRGGDRVVARLEKMPTSVILYLACLRTGAIFVPVNTANSTQEVEHFLNDARPHWCCCGPRTWPYSPRLQ